MAPARFEFDRTDAEADASVSRGTLPPVTSKASPRASTRHPERLASPSVLLPLTRALAVLDEILWPDWERRNYSFDRERDGTCLARMRNGEGDLWYLVFLPGGAAVLRGFDHESPMSPYRGDGEEPWPGLWGGIPRSLLPWKNAADIEPGEVTFVMWRSARGRWRTGPIGFPPGVDPDGSEWLLDHLDGKPNGYVRHVEARLGHPIDRHAVRAVYAGLLDAPTILKLNPKADAVAVLASARKMRFPLPKPAKRARATTRAIARDKAPRTRAPA
jgi:hypothetical protein